MTIRGVTELALVCFLTGCGGASSRVSNEAWPVTVLPGSDAGPAARPPLGVDFVVRHDGGVQPVTSLVYTLPFSIRVEGAQPGASVTLTTRLQRLSATAVFQASSEGVVDTATDAPMSGSYTGVDADGLIWSMTRAASSFATNYDVGVEADVDGQLLTARLARPGMGTGTRQTNVTAGSLPGQLFTFPGAERRPAVLVLGGSECNLDATAFMAAWVTTAGYHALAVDYCEQGIIERVPVEAVSGALDWLAQQPGVDPNRLAVFGASRGGELSLQLAAETRRLKAVVAIVPSAWRWGSTGPRDIAAWTLGGVDLPTLRTDPNAMGAVEQLPGGGQGLRLTPMFLASLSAATPTERAAAAIALGASSASFLLVGAEDDGVWPSCRFVDDGWAMLSASQHQATHPDDRALCLDGAGHGIGPPGWSTESGYASFNQSLGSSLVSGGTVRGRGRADRTFDTAWRAFLVQAFAR